MAEPPLEDVVVEPLLELVEEEEEASRPTSELPAVVEAEPRPATSEPLEALQVAVSPKLEEPLLVEFPASPSTWVLEAEAPAEEPRLPTLLPSRSVIKGGGSVYIIFRVDNGGFLWGFRLFFFLFSLPFSVTFDVGAAPVLASVVSLFPRPSSRPVALHPLHSQLGLLQEDKADKKPEKWAVS